jgi:hypothetical protein
MKTFVSLLTLGLILAFSAPAFAGTSNAPKQTEQSKTPKQQHNAAKQQEKKAMY